jgi:hypothetical protein
MQEDERTQSFLNWEIGLATPQSDTVASTQLYIYDHVDTLQY